MIHTAYRINAVLFDFDGTLSKPGTLDFPRLKKEIGCPPDDPVLEFIENLHDRNGARTIRNCECGQE